MRCRLESGVETLVDLLKERSHSLGEETAYTFLDNGEAEAGSHSYGSLNRTARTIAALVQRYADPGERALLLYPAGLDFLPAFFACLYAGVIAIPVDLPRRRTLSATLQILRDSGASLILSNSALKTAMDALLGSFCESSGVRLIDTGAAAADLHPDDFRPVSIPRESIAYLQYTSGSTSAPNGVEITHRNVLSNLAFIDYVQSNDESSRSVTWLPHFHDMGLVEGLLESLYSGHPCWFMSPAAFAQHPFRWLDAISRYRATNSGGPNFAYDLCVDRVPDHRIDSLALDAWRVAYNGAEPIRADTISRFADRFRSCGFRNCSWYPVYGLAEATLMVSSPLRGEMPITLRVSVSALEANQVVEGVDSERRTCELVASGRVHPHVTTLVMDPMSDTPCGPGAVGEIWIAGASVTRGYWGKVPRDFHLFNGKRFFRTGDLGFIRGSHLFVTGRHKDMIIIRGRNHYPQDIELTVQRSHDSLAPDACAAFTVPIGGDERLVVAQEVERSARQGDLSQLFTTIQRAVAAAHDLECVAIVLLRPMTLPKTSSGKVRRKDCRQAFLTNALDSLATWEQAAHPVNLLLQSMGPQSNE